MISTQAVMALGTDDGLTIVNATDHSVGSFHGFKVNLTGTNDPIAGHADTYYTWRVFTVDGPTVTQLTDFTKFQFVNYNPKGADFAAKFPGGNIGVAGVYAAQSKHSIGIQWLDAPAAGVYAVEVQEYNGADATFCSARRRFYVSVSNGDIDFILAAQKASDYSDISGDPTAALMTNCNTFTGGLIANAGATDLSSSTVYYKANMKIGNQAWNGKWGFDYNLTNSSGVTVNVDIVANTTDGAASVGAVNTTDKKITVNASTPIAYVKLTFTNRLGTPAAADVTLNFKEKGDTGNTTAFIVTGSGTGEENQFEPDANKANNLVKDDIPFLIKASPDTQAISVD